MILVSGVLMLVLLVEMVCPWWVSVVFMCVEHRRLRCIDWRMQVVYKDLGSKWRSSVKTDR
jgi:hypothetical protein